jgi:hypothetical protein
MEHDALPQDHLSLLTPVSRVFVKCIQRAYGEWSASGPPEMRLSLRGNPRASFIQGRAMHWLEIELAGHPGIRIQRKHHLRYLIIDGPSLSIALRPKRIGRDYRCRNYLTRQQKALREPGQTYLAWHNEKPVWIQLGFSIHDTDLEEELEEIALTHETRKSVTVSSLWASARRQDTITSNLQLMLPTVPPIRIRAKRRGTGEAQGG